MSKSIAIKLYILLYILIVNIIIWCTHYFIVTGNFYKEYLVNSTAVYYNYYLHSFLFFSCFYVYVCLAKRYRVTMSIFWLTGFILVKITSFETSFRLNFMNLTSNESIRLIWNHNSKQSLHQEVHEQYSDLVQ